MKKLILIFCCVLFISSTIDAQYRIYKTKYDYHNYKYQAGDPYHPTTAGFASFLLPGLGQIISGEVGRGAIFFGGFTGCIAIFIIGASGTSGPGLMLLGFTGIVATDIIAIVDASHVAKINNLAFRDRNKNVYNIKISPYIGLVHPDILPVGLSLRVRF